MARFVKPRSLIGLKVLQNCNSGAGACVHSPSAAGHRQGLILHKEKDIFQTLVDFSFVFLPKWRPHVVKKYFQLMLRGAY